MSLPAREDHNDSIESAIAALRLRGCMASLGESHMDGQMVLLRLVEGSREGWRWMALDEFMRLMSLDQWNDNQVLVGMVLPAGRRGDMT